MDHRLLSRNWLKCAKSDCSPNSIQCNHRNLHHALFYFFSVELNSVQICLCWHNWKNTFYHHLFVFKQRDKQTNKGWSKVIGESEILCVLVTPRLLVSQEITNNTQFISSTFTDWFLSWIWFIFWQLRDIPASLWYILANSWNKIRRMCSIFKVINYRQR